MDVGEICNHNRVLFIPSSSENCRASEFPNIRGELHFNVMSDEWLCYVESKIRP